MLNENRNTGFRFWIWKPVLIFKTGFRFVGWKVIITSSSTPFILFVYWFWWKYLKKNNVGFTQNNSWNALLILFSLRYCVSFFFSKYQLWLAIKTTSNQMSAHRLDVRYCLMCLKCGRDCPSRVGLHSHSRRCSWIPHPWSYTIVSRDGRMPTTTLWCTQWREQTSFVLWPWTIRLDTASVLYY